MAFFVRGRRRGRKHGGSAYRAGMQKAFRIAKAKLRRGRRIY